MTDYINLMKGIMFSKLIVTHALNNTKVMFMLVIVNVWGF